MKIACVSYRDWALQIYTNLFNHFRSEIDFLIVSRKEDFHLNEIIDFQPDYILFYGWSWIVPKELTLNFQCIMLHPSPLPKYRGGSPIQNQIINDEKISAVTLFLMTQNLDDGDIFYQKEFSLEGSLNCIFSRIIEIGTELTIKLICHRPIPYPQNHIQASYCKRRSPEESEITIDEIKNKPSHYLYNKIRMLQDPYPNAFISTADGKKLFITNSRLEI
jgi:methionyl-tRNA formyltransferase